MTKKSDIKTCSCQICKSAGKVKRQAFKAANKRSRQAWKQRGENKHESTGFI